MLAHINQTGKPAKMAAMQSPIFPILDVLENELNWDVFGQLFISYKIWNCEL